MLQGIRYKYLIVIVLIYVVIIFTGAFVVQTNNSADNKDLFLLHGYEQTAEDALSFLDGFVVEDVLEPPSVVDSDQEAKKVVKRSASLPTVPQYMLDVYERLSDKRLHIKFDTARSFHSSGLSDNVKKFPSPAVGINKESHLHRLIFNVSHFPETETVLFAQLRIQISSSDKKVNLESQNIEIFSLMADSSILLTSKYFNPSTEFLYTVNVTEIFHKALKIDDKVLQFELLIPDTFRDALILDSASTEGPQLLVLSKTVPHQGVGEDRTLSRMRRSLEEHNSNTAPTRPQSYENMEKFTDTKWNESEDASRLWRRAPRQRRSEEEDEEAEEQSNYIVEELGRIRKGKLKRKKNPCRRKPLHVNFAAINYDQWIIAPPSYEAFECTGRCSFPMSAHLAPTKHAIIQTLMHSLEPKQVSRASCVPIKLAPISILYVDDDGTVTYKYDYEDMVVAECGCR